MRRLALGLCLALAVCGCGDGDREGYAALGDLCAGIEGEYLDFYFDDLRSRQPDLWSRVLTTCLETCPASDSCAPVRSVALWYGEWPGRDRPGRDRPGRGRPNSEKEEP